MEIIKNIRERAESWLQKNWLSAMTVGCVLFWALLLFLLLGIPVRQGHIDMTLLFYAKRGGF